MIGQGSSNYRRAAITFVVGFVNEIVQVVWTVAVVGEHPALGFLITVAMCAANLFGVFSAIDAMKKKRTIVAVSWCVGSALGTSISIMVRKRLGL